MNQAPASKVHFLDHLLVVLVIHELNIETSPSFNSLTFALNQSQQFTSLLIYDNSLHPQSVPSCVNWKIHYYHNAKNPGVSKAYNIGFDLAKAENKEWLLLIDQDTTFPPDTFDQYYNGLEKFRTPIVVPILIDSLGTISPMKFYWGSGQRQKKLTMGSLLSLKEYFFINSGILISIEEFEKAQKYDEALPLDFSDFAFVVNLRKRNNYFLLANFICLHQLSSASQATVLQKVTRFKRYLNAARYYKNNYAPQAWGIPIRSLARALKLSFHYWNFEFIATYIRSI